MTPGYFSFLVSKALSPRSKQACLAHLDDIIVFSKDLDSHLADLESVFSDLLKANFLVSITKLKAFRTEVTYLGHILTGHTLSIPPARKSYFETMATPSTKKELQCLLGVATYMSSFVDSFHIIVGPLYDALKNKTNNEKITLSDIQLKAFHQLKQAITSAPNLSLIDYTKDIYMECDSSLLAVGSIVYQLVDIEKDGVTTTRRNILKYGSRKYTLTETLNSTSLEREGMALIISIRQHWDLLVSCKTCILKTDLKSLLSILACQNNPVSTKMSRISHTLYSLPFSWVCCHVPGRLNNIADYLSRNYACLYSDKVAFPAIDPSDIQLPAAWTSHPPPILTMKDLLQAMRDNILNIEKSSKKVKTKRITALIKELKDKQDSANYVDGSFIALLHDDTAKLEKEIAADKFSTPEAKISALRPVTNSALITPSFIAQLQDDSEELSAIKIHLKTTDSDKISKKTRQKYRLLNYSLLITRKDKRLPFDLPSNIRIVADIKMGLILLSYLHVFTGHLGSNQLVKSFLASFRLKKIYGLARMVTTCCRACQLYRTNTRKNLPRGRIPFPPSAGHTFSMDHMFIGQDITHKDGKVTAILNIVDNYSSLLVSYMVKDVGAATTKKCLENCFSILSPPRVLISDNATGLNANLQIATFLRSFGVTYVSTISAYNSKGNKTEIRNRIFRDVLQLTSETFKRSIPEIFHSALLMVNSRPLSLTAHPHIRSLTTTDDEIVTPFSLHHGFKDKPNRLLEMETKLSEEDRIQYKRKWEAIISKHNQHLQEEVDEHNKSFKPNDRLGIGSLCLYRDMKKNKNLPTYLRSAFEIVEIKYSKYTIRPLFGYSTGTIVTNGDNIKPYNFSKLFKDLPPKLRALMGQSLDPEALKEQVRIRPDAIPTDFENWGLFNIPNHMKLRRHITPASVTSEAAMSLSLSSLVTPTSDSVSIGTRSTQSRGSSQRHFKTTGSRVTRVKQPKTDPSVQNPLSTLTAQPIAERTMLTVPTEPPAPNTTVSTEELRVTDTQSTPTTGLTTAEKLAEDKRAQIFIHEQRHHISGLRLCDENNPNPIPCYSASHASDVVDKPSPDAIEVAPLGDVTDLNDAVNISLAADQPRVVSPGVTMDSPVHTSTPINTSTQSSNENKLTFSDDSGKPIATDEDSNQYRLSKRHEVDPSVRRHLPFDQSTDSASKSDPSITEPLKELVHVPTGHEKPTGARPKRTPVVPARFRDYATGKEIEDIESYEKSFDKFVNRLHPNTSPQATGQDGNIKPLTPTSQHDESSAEEITIPYASRSHYIANLPKDDKAKPRKKKPVVAPPANQRPIRKKVSPKRFLD